MKKTYEAHAQKPATAREVLPVGAYCAKIMSAKTESTNWGERLILAFDITDGEYKDFFKKDFDANTQPDKKWRGTFRINVPTGDGSEQDSYKQRAFNAFIWAVEASNKGYVFDWNEASLKGKAIGVNYRRKEWEIPEKGLSGWTTECGACEDIADVKAGKCRTLKDKPLKKSEAAAPTAPMGFTPIEANDDDLPF